jgi:hypothetical protein
MDHDLERVLAAAYLAGLPERDVAELRTLRADCRAIETRLSYLRRLVQGHQDIVVGELERRRTGGDPDDVGALVDRLPEILADRIRGPGSGRLPDSIESEEPSGRLAEHLEAIVATVPLEEVASVGIERLEATATELADLEGKVSALRRAMFDRIDVVEAELTRRYRDGEALVDDLLATEQAD